MLVISVDGARNVQMYYPFDGAMSAALPAGVARVELDGSIVLGDERIWVVLSASPLVVVPDDARRCA